MMKPTVNVSNDLNNRLNELVAELTVIERREHTKVSRFSPPEVVRWSEGKRWVRIDFCRRDLAAGNCGAWLVDIPTGEIYNIKGYGVPDHNKKKKADLGTVWNVNAEDLYKKRWNPLR